VTAFVPVAEPVSCAPVGHIGRRAGALLVALLLVAGCGGAKANGVDKLSPQAAIAKVKHDLATVKTVHVRGHFVDTGKTYAIDLRLKHGAGSGTITIAGGRMDVVRLGDIAYFRGDVAALRAAGATTAQAGLVAGRWLKGSATTGDFAGFAALLDLDQLTSQLLTPSGTVAKGKPATIGGAKAIALVDKGEQGGTLYIALTGRALPLRVVNTGSSPGTIDFFDYDAGVSVSAPAGAIDLSKLGG